MLRRHEAEHERDDFVEASGGAPRRRDR